jgi:hypothetical protein
LFLDPVCFALGLRGLLPALFGSRSFASVCRTGLGVLDSFYHRGVFGLRSFGGLRYRGLRWHVGADARPLRRPLTVIPTVYDGQ